MTALAATDVTYAFPDGRQAIGGCSLAVDSGEMVALLGANGAG